VGVFLSAPTCAASRLSTRALIVTFSAPKLAVSGGMSEAGGGGGSSAVGGSPGGRLERSPSAAVAFSRCRWWKASFRSMRLCFRVFVACCGAAVGGGCVVFNLAEASSRLITRSMVGKLS
jgi:hypothetical protein